MKKHSLSGRKSQKLEKAAEAATNLLAANDDVAGEQILEIKQEDAKAQEDIVIPEIKEPNYSEAILKPEWIQGMNVQTIP